MTWQELLAPINTLVLLSVAVYAGRALERLRQVENDVREILRHIGRPAA